MKHIQTLRALAQQSAAASRPLEESAALRQLASLAPEDAAMWRRLGYLELALGDHERAASSLGHAIRLDPSNPRAHNNLGQVLTRLGRHDEAAACYRRAIELDPTQASAHTNLGVALLAQGQYEAAARSCARAAALAPTLAAAHFHHGNALERLLRTDEALAAFERALRLAPEDPQILAKTCLAFERLQRPFDALALLEVALAQPPHSVGKYRRRGSALLTLGRHEEALHCAERAIAMGADAESWALKAQALRQLHRYEDALAACQQTLLLAPGSRPALMTRAEILMIMGQSRDADDCFAQLLKLDSADVRARLMHLMNQIPQVPTDERQVADSRDRLRSGLHDLAQWLAAHPEIHGPTFVGAATPFYLAYQEQCSLQLLRDHGRVCADAMARWQAQLAPRPRPCARRSRARKRVAIVSAHVRDHSVHHALVKGWLNELDREGLEVGVLHLGAIQDEHTSQARARSDFFIEGPRSLEQWLAQIEALEPDVMVYPEIGMHPMTLQLASLRLAPSQMAAWGHPQSTGLPTMDIYLSAEALEPSGAQSDYCERLVRLANLGCYYEPYGPRSVPVRPAQLGIRAEVPLLLSAGMPFKYAPQHDHLLPQIVRGVGDCQIVCFEAPVPALSARLQARLAREFREAGLDPAAHLVFVPWQDTDVFFALMRQAAVLLDTIGFSGFNTVMQALECGLPIVTMEGRFLRGRFGSGILRQAGLDDLIAHGGRHYVDLVVKAVTDARFAQRARDTLHASHARLFRDRAPLMELAQLLCEGGSAAH